MSFTRYTVNLPLYLRCGEAITKMNENRVTNTTDCDMKVEGRSSRKIPLNRNLERDLLIISHHEIMSPNIASSYLVFIIMTKANGLA